MRLFSPIHQSQIYEMQNSLIQENIPVDFHVDSPKLKIILTCLKSKSY